MYDITPIAPTTAPGRLNRPAPPRRPHRRLDAAAAGRLGSNRPNSSRGDGEKDGPLRRVQVEDGWIEYRIRRSRRRKKTYQISVRAGQVLVAAPYRTTNRQAEEMVRQKAGWILSKLAAQEPEPEAPRFLSGEKLPYCGRALTLWVEGMADVNAGSGGGIAVFLDRQRLRVCVPVGLTEARLREGVSEAVFAWYRERAAEQIWGHIDRWWAALGRGTGRPVVHIRNQKRRWGSCSHDGALRFNWRLAMLEPALTEYVVVHELAHLTHMNHSADFWGLVAEHLPDVKERRQRLREAGAVLPAI